MTGAGRAFRAISLGVLSALALSNCTPEPCDDVTAPPELSAFYSALHELERGARARPVRILHLGDSHIAGDRFSGSLQSRFAARFGDAGRGQMPPGIPFAYYRRQGIEFTSSENWTRFSSLSGGAVGPFGLSGLRLEAAEAGAWMRFRIADGPALNQIMLDLYEQPGGGTVAVELDGREVSRFETRSPVPGLMRVDLSGETARQVTLRLVGDGPVGVLGWGGSAATSGIVYEAHGIPGATVRIIDQWDEGMLAEQLRSMAPDLIILGYGTNEGFDDAVDGALYRRALANRMSWLRGQVPGASLAVIGAFDGARLPQWVESDVPRSALPCASLELHERATYGDLAANRDGVLGRWHAPPKLDTVRGAQAQAAAMGGAWYWDGAAAMGGACAIHDWVFADPPLAYGDHVHLTPEGADLLAERLWQALMRPYEAYACRRRLQMS